MTHHVTDAISNLVLRQGKIQVWVHDANHRPNLLTAKTPLDFLVPIGDDGTGAGFAAGSRDGQYRGQGQDLGGVDDAATPHSQDEGNIFPAAQFNSLMD